MAITNAVDILLDGIVFSSCNQGAKTPLVGDVGEEFSSILEGVKEGQEALVLAPDFSFSDVTLYQENSFDWQRQDVPVVDNQETIAQDQEISAEQDLPVPQAMLFYPDVISPHVLGHFLKNNTNQMGVDQKDIPDTKIEFASRELERAAVQVRDSLPVSKKEQKDFEPIDAKVYVKSFQKSQDSSQEKSQSFSFSKLPMSMIDVLQGEKSIESVGDFKEQIITSVPVMTSAVLPQKIENSVLEVTAIDITNIEITKTTKDTLEIQLFPESLGKVDVKLSFDQTSGHMKAVIIPETYEGYQAILKDETKLHASIQNVIQKDNGACVSLEMRVSEPKEATLSFSMENRGFGGGEYKNPQQNSGHGHHKHFFDSSFYAQSDVIPEVLDSNRRLDMAV